MDLTDGGVGDAGAQALAQRRFESLPNPQSPTPNLSLFPNQIYFVFFPSHFSCAWAYHPVVTFSSNTSQPAIARVAFCRSPLQLPPSYVQPFFQLQFLRNLFRTFVVSVEVESSLLESSRNDERTEFSQTSRLLFRVFPQTLKFCSPFIFLLPVAQNYS